MSQAVPNLPPLPAPHGQLVKHLAEHPDTPMQELLAPYRQYEAELRSVFAQDRSNPVLDDPHINVLPLFTADTKHITTRARDLAAESQEEKDRYMMPLPDEKRRAHGSPAVVADIKEFQKNFGVFSESSLCDLDWSNIVAAGSSVVNCLLPVPEKYNTNKRKLREYYHQVFCPAADVDLFLYGLTHEQAIEKIKAIEQAVRDALLSEVTVVRTKYAITIASQYPTRHIQVRFKLRHAQTPRAVQARALRHVLSRHRLFFLFFLGGYTPKPPLCWGLRPQTSLWSRRADNLLQIVLRVYKSISEILTGFDIDAAGGAYDGSQVYVTPRALGSFITQVNHIDLSRRSPSYENRLSKYSRRAFEVYWPDLERSRIDPTIYERSFGRSLGLARLLVMERLPTSTARDEYINKRRQERGRPTFHPNRFRMGGNIKDNFEDEVADWVDEADVSNYHTFTVPYGEKWVGPGLWVTHLALTQSVASTPRRLRSSATPATCVSASLGRRWRISSIFGDSCHFIFTFADKTNCSPQRRVEPERAPHCLSAPPPGLLWSRPGCYRGLLRLVPGARHRGGKGNCRQGGRDLHQGQGRIPDRRPGPSADW
jgi:hypothetical protein